MPRCDQMRNKSARTEKRSISGRDILRMDGLLPPTKRLPVCDAVTANTEKKKEKKWSIGGILRRISSIRDCDSSSNEEEMVYCKRGPRTRAVLEKKDCAVLKPSYVSQCPVRRPAAVPESVPQVVEPVADLCRDSIHSRSSDGSLDGLGKKVRRNKLKARAEAKRDRICGDSSSDEESRRSCNSLTKPQSPPDDSGQRNGSCNRKSRAARTERYIKRHSKDDTHSITESLTDLNNKRNTLDQVEENVRSLNPNFRPPVHPRRTIVQNSYTFPSPDNLRGPVDNSRLSMDLTRYPRYIMDMNQNTYAKPVKVAKKDKSCVRQPTETYTQYQGQEQTYGVINRSPPEPPPRDPRYRAVNYCSYSFPFNGRHQRRGMDVKLDGILPEKTFWCDRNEDTGWKTTNLCNSRECTNNRHNSTGRHDSNEAEAAKIQKRNDRNDQLNSNVCNRGPPMSKDTVRQEDRIVARRESSRVTKNSCESDRIMERKEASVEEETQRKRSSKNLEEALSELEAIYDSLRLKIDEDLLDRAERRSMEEFTLRHARKEGASSSCCSCSCNCNCSSKSKNGFNSGSNGIAGYNCNCNRGNGSNSNTGRNHSTVAGCNCKSTSIKVDSSDRTKDDMAYRRMHPKERPTSLSEHAGQAALTNISYLMASPILSRRRSSTDGTEPTKKDEPDVTRDDVVYRSISHANNTLKVADPQPPFGIPIGPVATATESDYLHTTPARPEQPRSPYIPQCEPDIVTDDLAYRTLRKDSRSSGSKDTPAGLGSRKKRAVRSLSANLYGLIDQDRIHLTREPNFGDLDPGLGLGLGPGLGLVEKTEQDPVGGRVPGPVQADSFRRVVSDGELSDWSGSVSRTDMNGNVPMPGPDRRKLRVYISPAARVEGLPGAEVPTGLTRAFWRESARSEAEAEPDITAYSRLCQDLVDLIRAEEGDDDLAAHRQKPSPQHSNLGRASPVLGDREPSVRVQTIGSEYPGTGTTRDNQVVDQLTQSMITGERSEDPDQDNQLDFYLKLADENVKLIAEAFSSVADHLRDSRVPRRQPEEESPTTATSFSSFSSRPSDGLGSVPSESPTTRTSLEDVAVREAADPELDLSRAVYDLQVAAASLVEREREIEELEAKLKRGGLNEPKSKQGTKKGAQEEVKKDQEEAEKRKRSQEQAEKSQEEAEDRKRSQGELSQAEAEDGKRSQEEVSQADAEKRKRRQEEVKTSQEEAEQIKRSQKDVRGSQEETESKNKSQDEAESKNRSQDEAEKGKRSQEDAEKRRRSQEEMKKELDELRRDLEEVKKGRGEAGRVRGSQTEARKSREEANKGQEQPKDAQNDPESTKRDDEVVKRGQKEPTMCQSPAVRDPEKADKDKEEPQAWPSQDETGQEERKLPRKDQEKVENRHEESKLAKKDQDKAEKGQEGTELARRGQERAKKDEEGTELARRDQERAEKGQEEVGRTEGEVKASGNGSKCCVSYVTNMITMIITTYSMVLLACFLALLLATVAASGAPHN